MQYVMECIRASWKMERCEFSTFEIFVLHMISRKTRLEDQISIYPFHLLISSIEGGKNYIHDTRKRYANGIRDKDHYEFFMQLFGRIFHEIYSFPRCK